MALARRFTAHALVSAIVVACGAPQQVERTGPPASASASSAPPALAASPADRGPRFERRTGVARAKRLGEAKARASRSYASEGHYWLGAPFEDVRVAETPAEARVYDTAWIEVHGDRHGVAFASLGSDGRAEILVRLVGKQAPSQPLKVSWSTRARRSSATILAGGVAEDLIIEPVAGNQPDPKLDVDFYAAASSWFRLHGSYAASGEPFFAFATSRLELLKELRERPRRPVAVAIEARATRQPGSELEGIMDLYTGMSSVEEALQTDRGLRDTRAPRERPSVRIESLSGPKIAAHPWPRMIAELGRQPVVEPLAAAVPNDMLYLHFHDLRTLVAIMRDLDAWVSGLAQALEGAGGFKDFGGRYDGELVVERSVLAEKFGHLAVEGVALCASDPYLREGTDVSVIFRPKSRVLLLGALDGFAENVRRARPDAKLTSFQAHGVRIDVLATADGEVSQHRLDLGSAIVISNSRTAATRFAEVAAKKRAPLAESGDFRYFRAKYPFDPKQEDGFLFASDAFVANTVGPRQKILEARRMLAAADLTAVNSAALLFGWLEGKRPADVRALSKSGLLQKHELSHADGRAIGLEPEAGARSAWGRPARLVSLLDQDVGMITPAEKASYERFRDTYQEYWRAYLDPIGVRLTRSANGKKLAFDARILPLIESSEYDSLIGEVGEQTVSLPRITSGLRFVLALGKDAALRQTTNAAAQLFTRRTDLGLSWVGDWVAAGSGDRSGLWDAALVLGVVPSIGHLPPEGNDLDGVLARTPLWGAVHVKNRLGAVATLMVLRTMADQVVPGQLSWQAVDGRRGVEITRVRLKENDLNRGEVFYALAKDVLLVSLDRATLDARIDDLLDGRMPQQAGRGDVQSAIELAPDAAGFMGRTLTALIEAQAYAAHTSASRSYEALARGLPGLPAEPNARRKLALAWLGHEPVSPFAGEFSIGERGLPTHSTRGSELEPIIPEGGDGPGSVLAVVNRLSRLRMTLAFEGKGAHRGLHSTFEWEER
jgi:hypothetical protein